MTQPPSSPDDHPTLTVEGVSSTRPAPRAGAADSDAVRLGPVRAPGPSTTAALQRVAALAAQLLGTPTAQVSLLTEKQTVVAGVGLPSKPGSSDASVAGSVCEVVTAAGAPLVVPDAVHDVRVNALAAVVSGLVGACLGVPLLTMAGHVAGAVCVSDPLPRSWSEADVAVMAHLAESVRAELELVGLGRDYDLSRARFDLAAQAGDIGTFDWDLVSDDLQWDDRLIAIYGYDAGDERFAGNLDSVNARLHPDDAALVTAAITDSIATAGPLQVRYRIVVPDVGVRWLEARARTLADESGTAVRMLGVTWDTTDRQHAEARAERVLATLAVGYLSMDRHFHVTYANGEAERLLRRDSSTMVGVSIWDLFPDTVDSEFSRAYRAVARTGTPETVEAYYPAPLNAWVEVQVVSTPEGVALYFADVTARHDAQQLVEVSVDAATQLADVDTVDVAASVLAQVVVPRLCDWAIVSLIDSDGSIRDVQVCHADPAMDDVLQRYASTRLDGGGTGVIESVSSTLRPYLLERGVVEFGQAGLKSAVAKRALQQLAPQSAAVVPLIADGAVVGVLTTCRGTGRAAINEQELSVLVSTCRRAVLAIDNARLHAEQAATAEHDRTVAVQLQHALLTALPEPDHLHLTARYLTAASADQVGGDWYDAVVADAGATTVMIGDVAGHDIAAAAVMGQLRTMLRVFALDDTEAPSTILQRLDRAARALKVTSTATAVTARIEQSPAARTRGLRTLRWSNAGHPPPILVTPDGYPHLLDGAPDQPRDTLIGVAPDRPRHDHTHDVAPGSTLLLYTDGLIETRDDDLDTGITRLCDSLARHHDKPTDLMLDAVLTELVGDHPADDVAALVVRFNPEDRPRPADAGPAHL